MYTILIKKRKKEKKRKKSPLSVTSSFEYSPLLVSSSTETVSLELVM